MTLDRWTLHLDFKVALTAAQVIRQSDAMPDGALDSTIFGPFVEIRRVATLRSMKAIVVTDQAAGTAGMKLVERPAPVAAINDVIVRVHAAGFVNTELDWPSTWTDRLGRPRTADADRRARAGRTTAPTHRHDRAARRGRRRPEPGQAPQGQDDHSSLRGPRIASAMTWRLG